MKTNSRLSQRRAPHSRKAWAGQAVVRALLLSCGVASYAADSGVPSAAPPGDKPAPQPVEKADPKAAENATAKAPEKPDEKEAGKPAERPADKAEKAADKTDAKADEKSDEKAADKADEKAGGKSDEKSSGALTPEQMFEGGAKSYNNWVEFSAGGLLTRGNTAQAEERHRLPDGAFGGIEDLHYRQEVSKGTTLTLDGRGIADDHDYRVSLDVTREKLGYVRFNAQNARTWSNGDGGYYAPVGVYYSLPGNALFLDRGEISVEAGFIREKLPNLIFKYAHRYREGEKGSTSWGLTHPDSDPTRVLGLSPTVYRVDEAADVFQLDATHRIKATDLGLGLRYETGRLDDARRITEYPNEPVQRKITDRSGTTYDLFSVNAFTETWIKKNLFFSSGVLFSDLDSQFTGSRIYGDDFDVGYVPGYPLGYQSLNGGAHKNEYLLNLNLMSIPLKNLSIVPSIRVQKEDWNADSGGVGTQDYATGSFSGVADRSLLDVRERLDATYKGVTNWVFRVGGEWTQGDGNLKEDGGLGRVQNRPGVGPIQRETEDARNFQKYSVGARWYHTPRLTLDFGGYYKLNTYDYDHLTDNTPNNSPANTYPAYLVMQDFDTYDGNVRMNYRPVPKVTLASRYDYQWSTVRTGPDPASGLSSQESAKISSQIFSQNINWTPWSRLYLQVGFNYVVSETSTPTADYTQAVLDAGNNYWTLNFNSGVVLDAKTDLNLGYFYYQADNLEQNWADGLPLGMAADEHGVTAALTHRLKPNVLLTLRYGFFDYAEQTFGGNRDCQSHVLFASVRYRF